MLPRYAPRRDPGEESIVAHLRAVGALVWRLSSKGLPDLLCGYRGVWLLLEVKAPAGERGGHSRDGQHLQPEQRKFFSSAELAKLPAYVVRSPEEALDACKRAVARSG